MKSKKILSVVIVAELALVLFASIPTDASPKSTERVIGGVYSPGDDFNSVTSDIASYGNATFYTPNTDQTGAGKYDVQYYNNPFNRPAGADSSKYPIYYGNSPWWPVPENLYNNTPGGTEYMVIVETINGVNDWSGANFTGSTNMTGTGDDIDYMPNVYLEQIPTPKLKSVDPASGEIVINWTGLYENISDDCYDGMQSWIGSTSNILNYSVYRSMNGKDFVRVGNSTPQVRGGEVWFEDTVEPGDYEYRIAVNYRYEANTGTSVIDENGVNPENTEGLPGIFVGSGRSNVSEVICTDITGPIIENMQPADESVLNTNTTTISANYSDDSGIDVSSVVLEINGIDYASEAVITETGISYDYTNMSDGNYTVYLEVKDNSSNHKNASKTWSFTVDTAPPEVTAHAPAGDEVLVFDEVAITFSEPMDTTVSMEDMFSITSDLGDPGGWAWSDWYENDTKVRGTHNNFDVNTTYTCTINTNAKDKAGNSLDKDYSWNFTTIANLSVTLNWPYIGTERWTGGSNHTISYSVGGGLSPYTIYLNYTTDGTTFAPIYNETGVEPDTYTYLWEEIPSIDSETVQVRIEVIDNATPKVKLSDTSDCFIIDSAKPTVNQMLPLNDSYTPLESDIVIVFNESMNTTSVGATDGNLTGCICTPDPGGWTAVWSDGDKKLTLSHDDFIADQVYTFNVTTGAKDKSDPGNKLNELYSWSFTAVVAKGVFTVSIDYPTSAEVDKKYQVTVTVNNAGLPTAYNTSGTLTVKFWKIHAGETPVQIGTAETINAMQPGASETKSSALFTFDKPGTWYIKVEVSSTNSIDVIQGYIQSYDTSVSVNVVKPEEAPPAETPYLTIAAGVIVLLILIGIIVALMKKKK